MTAERLCGSATLQGRPPCPAAQPRAQAGAQRQPRQPGAAGLSPGPGRLEARRPGGSRLRAVAEEQAPPAVPEAAEAGSSSASGAQSGAPRAKEWELDFSSRPLLDERGKKRWELLICDADRTWEYARYFPNNKVNSTQLRAALEEVLALPGAERPQRARFFRAQMQNIISKALEGLGIQAVPSRRCYSLVGWLTERLESVYKADPSYTPSSASSFLLDLGAPEALPDNLRGESWGFVQLPLGVLRGEMRDVAEGRIFGSVFPPERAGLEDMSDETLIPGVAIYSRRAEPVAAWLGSYEVARVVADTDRSYLVLETAVTQRWRYASYRRGRENDEEARAWEAAKVQTRGLHFLVLQTDAEAEQCAGLWLLLDQPLPAA